MPLTPIVPSQPELAPVTFDHKAHALATGSGGALLARQARRADTDDTTRGERSLSSSSVRTQCVPWAYPNSICAGQRAFQLLLRPAVGLELELASQRDVRKTTPPAQMVIRGATAKKMGTSAPPRSRSAGRQPGRAGGAAPWRMGCGISAQNDGAWGTVAEQPLGSLWEMHATSEWDLSGVFPMCATAP